jgi:hypothetical protein
MKYSDIASIASNRFRLPASHPILATISIDPVDWFRFQQLDDDNPATRIIAYDDPANGVMTVYVAARLPGDNRATYLSLKRGSSRSRGSLVDG